MLKELIIQWICSFLKDRSISVKINGIISIEFQIETDVHQGGVLSPIFFSIFINGLIFGEKKFRKSTTFSNLFADDFSTLQIH
jgi:hypothetical protein